MSDDEKFLQRCETSPLRSEAIEILCRMVRERAAKIAQLVAELAQVKAEVDRVWKIHNDFLNVQYFNQGRELIDTRQQLYDAETEITALKAKLEVAVGALEALYNRSNPGATCSIARDALARIEELGRKA